MVETKKNDQPMVSVIVPFYNVELYIGDCIESIFIQDYSKIELIFIDDCGSDSSSTIVEEYVKKAPSNIKCLVLKHSLNKGLSAARNTGTNAAHGDYIIYVDSDDRLISKAISSMVDQALKENADMVVGDYIAMQEDKIVNSTVPVNTASGLIVGTSNILDCYCHHGFYMMAWNKLIRTSLIKNNNVKFIEGIIHEDNPWSMNLVFLLERIVVFRKDTYIYTVRPGSIVTGSKLDLKRKSWFRGLQSYIGEINKYPLYKDNYAFHEYMVSETLSFLYFVGHHFNSKITWNVLKDLNLLSYKHKYHSPLSKSLPITHRIFNLMLMTPTLIRYILLKITMAIK